jgi:hypothetical protein
MPGVAKNMPMMAQKTASIVTRGFVKTTYWRHFGIGLTADPRVLGVLMRFA